MGCVPDDHRCEKDELPRHEVAIKPGFWITTTEVTVNAYVYQFKREPPKTETNPRWKYTDLPVTKVKWQDAEDYCEWVGGRLPTEAQWEYAARGGATDDRTYPWGNKFDANRCNSEKYKARRKVYPEATPVSIFPANGWNLFGMIGNVREWVLDVYNPASYSEKEPSTDPRASEPGKDRVVRGGSFGDAEKQLRTSARDHRPPGKFDNATGFRCVILQERIDAK
jgi:formylglycine-generating enzyme required for sulfatase activity